jgi:cell wall-associated NlpC family hydrolase
VGGLPAAAYRSGGTDLSLGALVSSSSSPYALSAVSMLGVLANRQSGIMERMKAAQVVAGVLDTQASGALDAVSRAADAAQAAKAAVEAKVAQQTSQVAAINAQVAQLTTALAAARAHSSALTHARSVGLAKAAAAAAAARAAARRHHQPSGGGSGGGGSGGGSGGGGGGGGGQGTSAGAAEAIAFAKAQLGDPYQWGATGPSTWDCSGLTMRAWAAGGVSLPHWSVAQWQVSAPVSQSDARPGDLVFYAYNLGDYRSIHHVALYLGGGLMIEAPFTGSVVRISSVDRPDLFGFARP